MSSAQLSPRQELHIAAPKPSPFKFALVLVDLQHPRLDDVRTYYENCAKLARAAVEMEQPVLLTRNVHCRWGINGMIYEAAGNRAEIVPKSENNAFSETLLSTALRYSYGVEKIAVGGYDLLACAGQTIIGAANSGFGVLTSMDILATDGEDFEPQFAERITRAHEKIQTQERVAVFGSVDSLIMHLRKLVDA